MVKSNLFSLGYSGAGKALRCCICWLLSSIPAGHVLAQPVTWRDIRFEDAPVHLLDIKKDFGATGDGKADDSRAFSRAVATGKAIQIPAGTYLIKQPFQLVDSTAWYGQGKPILRNCSGKSVWARGRRQ